MTLDIAPLRLITDENGEFESIRIGTTVLVSELCEKEVIDLEAELESRGFEVNTRDLEDFLVKASDIDREPDHE